MLWCLPFVNWADRVNVRHCPLSDPSHCTVENKTAGPGDTDTAIDVIFYWVHASLPDLSDNNLPWPHG